MSYAGFTDMRVSHGRGGVRRGAPPPAGVPQAREGLQGRRHPPLRDGRPDPRMRSRSTRCSAFASRSWRRRSTFPTIASSSCTAASSPRTGACRSPSSATAAPRSSSSPPCCRRVHATGRDSILDLDDQRIDTCLARSGAASRHGPRPRGSRSGCSTSRTCPPAAPPRTSPTSPRSGGGRSRRTSPRRFGLTFAGVDLACSDIRSADADYSVIEVNAAPGLDHYAAVGERQARIVRDLYARVLNLDPGLPELEATGRQSAVEVAHRARDRPSTQARKSTTT